MLIVILNIVKDKYLLIDLFIKLVEPEIISKLTLKQIKLNKA